MGLSDPVAASKSAFQGNDPIAALFSDAWERLPPLARSALTDPLTGHPLVSLRLDRQGAALPDTAKFCSAPENQEELELARYEPRFMGRGGVVALNAALLAHHTPEDPGKSPIACRHGSLHSEALAAVLHELGHAYEREAARGVLDSAGSPFPVPSADERFLRIADFAPGWFTPTNKNSHPSRSPDLYETRSAQESFAVNFEYFLLDGNFACRRPSYAEYLSRAFRFDPFPDRTCQVNTQAFAAAGAANLLRDLDPSRIHRVDYLMAAPGTNFVSRWGHAMLRLAICAPERIDSSTGTTVPATPFGPGCAENTFDHVVVSYRADLRGIAPGIWSLVRDRLPSRPFLITFDEIFREYLYGDLRDLVAYPIPMTESEKRALVHRILESYWNYEGDYHFLGNNCATETRDLVASIKEGAAPGSISSARSPTGLRDDWESSRWIDTAKAKTYPSMLPVLKRIWNDQAILSGPRLSGDAQARSILVEYMRESRARDRWGTFVRKLSSAGNRPASVRDFIVFEAQILRLRSQRLEDEVFYLGRKKAPALFRDYQTCMLARPDRTGGGAYGIPSPGEIPSEAGIAGAGERLRRSLGDLKAALQDDLADPIAEIQAIRENIRKAIGLQRDLADPTAKDP